MITKEALDAARARGAQKVLARYGLDKLSGVLSTLGGAATRALRVGTRVYQRGGGNMLQNLGGGIAAGAKIFQRAGGVPAAGKALGAAAAGGAAAYGAGRMFGAGQQAAQKQAEDTEPHTMARVLGGGLLGGMTGATGGLLLGAAIAKRRPNQAVAEGLRALALSGIGGSLGAGVGGYAGWRSAQAKRQETA